MNYPFKGKIADTQAIQDVDEFISSSEQIWRNLALNHLLTNGSSYSEWVPSEWESKQLIKTSVIHPTPVHRSTSCAKSCVFVRKKSFIHKTTFSSEKVISSESGEKSAPFKTVLNKYVCGFQGERTTGDGLFHWRKHYYGLWTGILAKNDGIKVKTS